LGRTRAASQQQTGQYGKRQDFEESFRSVHVNSLFNKEDGLSQKAAAYTASIREQRFSYVPNYLKLSLHQTQIFYRMRL
jgi:hypothetical protein